MRPISSSNLASLLVFTFRPNEAFLPWDNASRSISQRNRKNCSMNLLKPLLLASIVVLAGCASGVKHKDMAASITTIPVDQGRLYFWRSSSMLGAAIQPGIMLDGKRVGESKPGGFFYVDAPAGNHEVMMTTEVEKKLTFTLDKGETKYVKSAVGLGLIVYRIYPELAGKEESLKELSELAYIGDQVVKR